MRYRVDYFKTIYGDLEKREYITVSENDKLNIRDMVHFNSQIYGLPWYEIMQVKE